MSRPTDFRPVALARAIAIVAAFVVLVAVSASAAELVSSQLSGMVNNVTVEQGQTVTFQISLSATGTIRCAATPAKPATSKVDTHYVVDGTGVVSSDTPSAPAPFYADPFCNVTWPQDPAPQVVTATVTVAVNTPLGNHAIRLHTLTTTPPGTGATLRDDTPTFVTFHVVPGSDKTPPSVSCSGPSGTAGLNGWFTSEVSYACSSSDAGSGLADPSDASFMLATSGDGAASTPSRTVKDKAGNAAVAGPFGPFNIDTVPPGVTCGAPAGTLGLNGWYTSPVVVSCTASDATSGLAVPSDSSFTMSTSGEGSRSIGARAVADGAGSSTSTGGFGPFTIDLNDPSVSVSSPGNGASYILGSAAHASFGCTDTPDGSGIETCAGTSADGSALDTSTVGMHQFTVTARDQAGRTTSLTHSYSVVYAFGDLSAPAGKSSAKAGSAVPIWFSLGGVSDLTAVRNVTSSSISCDVGAPRSSGDPVSMNGRGLRYETPSNRFTFVWKTEKAWSGGCRQLQITLKDGTTHTATFTFR
jgi:hypothetical protein